MPAFTIEHLGEQTLLDAWPLLRSAGAEPLPDWWENEGLELMRRGGGVLAARAPDGAVYGIATYECVHRSHAGSVLAVDRLVTFELNRKEPVKEALGGALHMIASAFCCSSIALPLPAKGYVRHRARQIYREGPQPDV
nr:hypothetical protein [Sphingomonas sp.]